MRQRTVSPLDWSIGPTHWQGVLARIACCRPRPQAGIVVLPVKTLPGRKGLMPMNRQLQAPCLWMSLLFLACCSAPLPPEQALRDTIDAAEIAIEQHDNSALHNLLADDFIGPDGMDVDGARRLARVMFLRNQDIGVVMGPLQISLLDEHATVRCSAALTGGAGGLLPDSGQLYDITSGWRLEDGEWRMTSIEWKSR